MPNSVADMLKQTLGTPVPVNGGTPSNNSYDNQLGQILRDNESASKKYASDSGFKKWLSDMGYDPRKLTPEEFSILHQEYMKSHPMYIDTSEANPGANYPSPRHSVSYNA